MVQLRPTWSRQAYATLHPNHSFLFDIRSTSKWDDIESLEDRYLNQGEVEEIRRRYEGMSREVEYRRNYGLMDQGSEYRFYYSELPEFEKDIKEKARHLEFFRRDGVVKKIREAAYRDPVINRHKNQIGLVAGIASVYGGAPIEVSVHDRMKLSARTFLAENNYRVQQVKLSSSIVDGAFDFGVGDPPASTAQTADVFDFLSKYNERYRLSLSREVPLLDVASGLSYGSTSNTLSASVSKRLTDNLTFVVDSIRPVNTARSEVKVSEDRFRLLYGLSF